MQLSHSHLRQKVQQRECFGAPLQRSKSKFRNNEWMHDYLPLLKSLAKFFVPGPKVINPNRRIRKDHFHLPRGTVFNSGIVPARDANLRALSRSMRALSASRINAVFSATPVNSWAIRTSSSSSATVVRI
jgi:hypothetical protein